MRKLALLTCLYAFFAHPNATGKWHYGEENIMGTNIEVQVWAEERDKGTAAIEIVFEQMNAVNQLMSPYLASSQLYAINTHAATRPVVVDEALFNIIENAVAFSELSEGAFDITFASVGFMYDYRARAKPSQESIDGALDAINYRHIVLESTSRSISFLHPDVKIDLGGIAKGYAVDAAIEALAKMGIKHALVTAGGDTRLLGDRRGRPWIVGIRDPRNEDRQAVTLPLENIAISTSGDYERFFEEDGERYHHILSPKTGKSAYEVQSVSIIGPSSLTNDALSTTVFVMGVKAGISLINTLPDYEAIVLDNTRRLHYSNGLTQ